MKKLFLVVLAAGLFVACGNKTNEEATTVDSNEVEEVVVDEPVIEEAAPVAEATTVAETPAQKEQTIKEVAEEAGKEVAKEGINAAKEEAISNIKGKSSKGNR